MIDFITKEYDLKFIIDKKLSLNYESIVSLENKLPKSLDDYYWVEKVEHKPMGFFYTLGGLDGQYHESELYPLSPVLVSNELLEIGDRFYCDGEIHEVFDLHLDEEKDKWVVCCNYGLTYLESEVYKVVATLEQFGWFYNEGPPHDRNYNWVDSRYLENYTNRCIKDVIKNGLKMTILVGDTCHNVDRVIDGCSCITGFEHVPMLHDGKVIFDIYGILKNDYL